jgi:hypothetical protein
MKDHPHDINNEFSSGSKKPKKDFEAEALCSANPQKDEEDRKRN